MFVLILQAFILLAIFIDVLVSLLWVFHYENPKGRDDKKPFVSILVAARNEEENISSCLEHLLAQEYENFEILVGNDGSSDRTVTLALEMARNCIKNRITVHNIKAGGKTRGKANVLAQLAGFAAGEIFFFTDADVKLPKTWINSMLVGFDENTGLLTGITGVGGESFWERFQHLDWIIAIGMVKVVSDLGFPVTALGNNMAITRKAYEAVGGFEAIPFSVTEDFEILRHISAAGFATKGVISPGVCGVTGAQPDWKQLLEQRKRWMKGALKLPLLLVFLLGIQAISFSLLIMLAMIFPWLAALIFLARILTRCAFAGLVSAKMGKKTDIKALIFYEIYSGVLSLMLAIFYLLPIKIRWKGRKY